MSLSFLAFTWLMGIGFLAGGYEILELANGWPHSVIVLSAAGGAFAIGLIGYIWRWRVEVSPRHR